MPAAARKAKRLRRHPDTDDEGANRSPFQRDRDRLLYSSAFRRLAGVTQVAGAHEHPLLHNRLTHSLKVAQIGRRMAERLIRAYPRSPLSRRLDPDIVELAGLAHDIGHPPFGHSAEKLLDKRLAGAGGFEGNAQSFRIVTKISVSRQSLGLNLSHRSLAAILKYPSTARSVPQVRNQRARHDLLAWTNRAYGSKWGIYESEKADFAFARSSYDALQDDDVRRYERTPEAILMDWADDISYATHDIEDYYRVGLIPLNDLARHEDDMLQAGITKMLSDAKQDSDDPALAYDLHFDEGAFRSALTTVKGLLPNEVYSPTRQQRLGTHNSTSAILDYLTAGLTVLDDPPWIVVNADVQYVAEVLKTLTRYFVINSPATSIAREGHVKSLEVVYTSLQGWLRDEKTRSRVPQLLQDMHQAARDDAETMVALAYDQDKLACRATADYLCTLTEAQTVDLAQRLTGVSPASMFGAWFGN